MVYLVCIDIDLDKCIDILIIVLCFSVVVSLLGICIVYGKQIIKCVKKFFYGNYDFIKSLFQGIISTITTMLAFKPILSTNVYYYALTFGALFFLIMIFSFQLQDAKREIKRAEKLIVFLAAGVCAWVAYLNFNTSNSC